MLSSRIPRAGTTLGSWAEGGAEEGKATSPPRATFHQSCTPLYGVGSFQKLPHPKSSLLKQARNAISEIHSPELRFFNVTKPWDSGLRNLHNAAAWAGVPLSLVHHIISPRLASVILACSGFARRVTSRRLLGLGNVGPEVRTAS